MSTDSHPRDDKGAELLQALERQRQLLNELARTCAKIGAALEGKAEQQNRFVVSK